MSNSPIKPSQEDIGIFMSNSPIKPSQEDIGLTKIQIFALEAYFSKYPVKLTPEVAEALQDLKSRHDPMELYDLWEYTKKRQKENQ